MVAMLTSVEDWDEAYANAPYIPDGEGFPARWAAAAEAFRAERIESGHARVDISYGSAEREAFDLFLPDGTPEGLLVFVHGGYWRAFSRSDWSHLAKGPTAMGWAVAMPSYTLCPEGTVSGITGQITRAVNQAAGFVQGPIRLAGHSAGGHLVSRMICANSALSRGVADRIDRVMSISGVHDLRPLLKTQLNRDLRLDFAEATAESPALLPPGATARLHAWVGGDERPEFIRQSELIANIWRGCGAETALTIERGKHHFDVIEGLAQPGSPMLKALLEG